MLAKSNCFFLLYFLLLIPLKIEGQNLIIDPGFEEVELVLEDDETVYQYNYWTSLLKFKKLSPRGLPIFSEYAKKNKTDKYFSYWIPYEGDSYMFSDIVYFRNLYQTKLREELIVGKKYKVNFKYKVGANGFSKEKIENSINNKLGVKLTTKDMSDSSGLSIIKNQNISLKPQIRVTAFNADSLFKWVDFTYFFEADKAYEYLIIGNFSKLIESYELSYHPITGISYKIDEVSIELAPDTVILTKNQNEDQTIINTLNLNRPELMLTGEMTDSVYNYYAHINKAEEFIIKNLLDSSIIEYHKAFTWKTPFFRDRRNAKSVIQLNPLFDSLLIVNFLPCKQSVAQKNKLLLSQIDSVYNLDQICRNNNLNIATQDSFNFSYILKTVQNEVISENNIGVNGVVKLNTILLHLSRYPFFYMLAEELYKHVLEGNFENKQFATLMDSYYENNISSDKTKTFYLSNSIFPLYTKFIIPQTSSDQLLLTNNNRINLGLESLQVQYQKQFYNFKFGYRDYEFYQIISYFPFDPDSEDLTRSDYMADEDVIEQEISSKYGILVIYKR